MTLDVERATAPWSTCAECGNERYCIGGICTVCIWSDLRPAGNPRILTRTLARANGGGTVTVTVAAVHAHSCPHWRIGKRHGLCDCGAGKLWEELGLDVERATA